MAQREYLPYVHLPSFEHPQDREKIDTEIEMELNREEEEERRRKKKKEEERRKKKEERRERRRKEKKQKESSDSRGTSILGLYH